MVRQSNSWLRDHVAALPAWMLMLSGAALLGIALLVPAWLEARELNWQRDLMQLQIERLQKQEESFNQFLEGLETEDPTLLTRVALVLNRKKPVGSEPIATFDRHSPQARLIVADHDAGRRACAKLIYQTLEDPRSGNVNLMLLAESPKVGKGADIEPLPILRSRIVRLVTGPMRFLLAAAAVLCLAASMYSRGRHARMQTQRVIVR